MESESRKLMDKIEKKLLGIQSSHFVPIKWALDVIYEAQERKEIDSRLVGTLTNEINALHTQCDRLINFKSETFSMFLTHGAKTSVYCYFVIGAVSELTLEIPFI